MKIILKQLSLSLTALLLLIACGGGGNDSPASGKATASWGRTRITYCS